MVALRIYDIYETSPRQLIRKSLPRKSVIKYIFASLHIIGLEMSLLSLFRIYNY